jgi:sec-independent protein translocase protein TatA
MGFSLWHMLVVLAVVLVVFGAGRLPNVMGDLGKGVRNFKAGLDGKTPEPPLPPLTPPPESLSSPSDPHPPS